MDSIFVVLAVGHGLFIALVAALASVRLMNMLRQ